MLFLRSPFLPPRPLDGPTGDCRLKHADSSRLCWQAWMAVHGFVRSSLIGLLERCLACQVALATVVLEARRIPGAAPPHCWAGQRGLGLEPRAAQSAGRRSPPLPISVAKLLRNHSCQRSEDCLQTSCWRLIVNKWILDITILAVRSDRQRTWRDY